MGGLGLALAIGVLSGCESAPRQELASDFPVNPQNLEYVHARSGMVFPKEVDGQRRVSVTADAPFKNCVRVYYSRDRKSTVTDQLSFVLNSEIALVPQAYATPEAWIEKVMESDREKPSFAREEYRGVRAFGNDRVYAAQWTFDRPVWNDRALAKLLVIPRGSDLVCFEFVIATAYEKEWQPVIDRFVATILAGSRK